jgi:hypothetical protein
MRGAATLRLSLKLIPIIVAGTQRRLRRKQKLAYLLSQVSPAAANRAVLVLLN